MPLLKLNPVTRVRPTLILRSTFATRPPKRPPQTLYSYSGSRPKRNTPNSKRQRPQASGSRAHKEPEKKPTLSDALRETRDEDNSLLSPVHIPEDPHGILNEKHPAASILANSGLVVQRQLELMNVFIGFEQANKYVILDPLGNQVGFIAEQDNSMGKTMARQMFSTHRSFTAHVFDNHEKEVLRFHRPFSWISSRIGVYDPVEIATGPPSTSKAMITSAPGSLSTQVDQTSAQISPLSLGRMRVIGEAQQQWAPLRRKYNLFLFHQSPNTEANLGTRQIASGDLPLSSSQQLQVSQPNPDSSTGEYSQFAYVDEPFLSWDFSLRSAQSQLIGSVNRNWGGIGRELFTDTGVYALRMDAAGLTQQPQLPGPSTGQTDVVPYKEEVPAMTLDQRAVMLATAVSIDFDYFSRHSGAGGGMGWMPLWFPMGGGESAAAGEAAGEAGALGSAAEGSVIRDEGAAAGAAGMGTMAGYEAMQRGAGRGGENSASPTAGQDGAQDDWGGRGSADGSEAPWGRTSQDRGNRAGGDDGGGGFGGDGVGGDGGATLYYLTHGASSTYFCRALTHKHNTVQFKKKNQKNVTLNMKRIGPPKSKDLNARLTTGRSLYKTSLMTGKDASITRSSFRDWLEE
ncbi:MAG: hypothetical protein Q9170_006712 [Blastenia crenularia]